jgi:hypothetical protein
MPENGAGGDEIGEQGKRCLSRAIERIKPRALEVLQEHAGIELADVYLTHCPVAKLALGNFFVGQQSNLLVPVVSDNGIEQIADLIASTLDDLDEQIFGNAEKACDPEGGIVLA